MSQMLFLMAPTVLCCPERLQRVHTLFSLVRISQFIFETALTVISLSSYDGRDLSSRRICDLLPTFI
jgi:hypothetical protein